MPHGITAPCFYTKANVDVIAYRPTPVPALLVFQPPIRKAHALRILIFTTLRTKPALALGMTAETRPLCLHVYRIGGIWGDDKIVRADDKKTPRYYLKGTRLAASWQFALHVGGPNGIVVCHVKSPYLGPPLAETDPGPISITGSEWERQIVQVHRGKKSSGGAYLFRGPDDKEYRWRPISWLLLECLDSQDQVVATYRITLFAISKDGELRIHQPAQSMGDLIVATCLAIRTPDH
ncbi:hypothetical protein OG21DRAFT_1507222 [Imleria badia]|nr:hypothetical protein OG21DRAFT_1507222 [Imleria badia]